MFTSWIFETDFICRMKRRPWGSAMTECFEGMEMTAIGVSGWIRAAPINMDFFIEG